MLEWPSKALRWLVSTLLSLAILAKLCLEIWKEMFFWIPAFAAIFFKYLLIRSIFTANSIRKFFDQYGRHCSFLFLWYRLGITSHYPGGERCTQLVLHLPCNNVSGYPYALECNLILLSFFVFPIRYSSLPSVVMLFQRNCMRSPPWFQPCKMRTENNSCNAISNFLPSDQVQLYYLSQPRSIFLWQKR